MSNNFKQDVCLAFRNIINNKNALLHYLTNNNYSF